MTIRDLNESDKGAWQDFWNSPHGKKWMEVLEARIKDSATACYRMTSSKVTNEDIVRYASAVNGQEDIVEFIKATSVIQKPKK